MIYRFCLLVAVILVAFSSFAQKRSKSITPSVYYPEKQWETKQPADVGMDPALLKEAVDFAIASDASAPRNLKLNHYRSFGREPFGDAIGPIKDRGDQTGIIIKNGYVIAEWGEPWRVDMTHSVTKSFLSSVVGLAYDRGLIRSIDDEV